MNWKNVYRYEHIEIKHTEKYEKNIFVTRSAQIEKSVLMKINARTPCCMRFFSYSLLA